ncbi:MAG TPA: PAS domain S-box protein [Alphaproteobacteria bacterium]
MKDRGEQPRNDVADLGLTDARRLRLLVDAFTDCAIYMLDPRGFVTSWSAGAEAIKGYGSAEITGRHFSIFFTPEDRAQGVPERTLEDARRAGRCETEGWRVRKDGSRFLALAVVHAVHGPGGEVLGFAKIARDITERRAAQEALHDSERRFRLLVDGVVDYAIYMLDPSGTITNWNAGAERLKGYTADEIVGQHFSRFYTREDRAAGLPARALEQAARAGRYEGEGWRLRNDGGRFWASVVVDPIRGESGELIGFAKITRDITERRAAQEALRESERQFRLLVRGVTDYALYMLDPNGNVMSWNAGAERIKGYTADDIIGQHFSRFYTDQERAAGVPARGLRTAEHEGRFEAETWRVRKDGSLFWASVIIDPIRDERGRLIGFAKITRDVTERRNADIALQRAQAQRNQAQKMEALGELTGGVAHDFNNLLMIVNGHLQTLKKLIADEPAGRRSLDAIERAASRGESLTRQLLSFSRRQTLHPVVVDLGERLSSFRALLASSAGSAANLTVAVAPDTWPVEIDESEFELALVNIALNARDAMPQGGTVSIVAQNVQLRAEDTPAGLAGEYASLAITDTGTGIAPDILPKVFDPFFSTKQKDKGTGLGLSQVHGFAHQSGGTVTITSELGRGTTITLYLPRANAAVRSGPSEPGPAAHAGHETVLLVEDNPDVVDVTRTMLEELGYRVDVSPDASAALEAIERQRPPFDLVISDIVMAGSMDGLGLARAIRARHADLPIMLVTGYSEAAGSAETEFPVLRKPYTIAELSRATAKMLSRDAPPASNLVHLSDARRGGKSGEPT